MTEALVTVVAAALALGLPGPVRGYLRRRAVLDLPTDRSSHVTPVLRGGGLAPGFAVVVGASLLTVVTGVPWPAIIAGAVAAAAILGWIEDVRGLPIVWRAGVQLAIGLALGLAAWAAGSGVVVALLAVPATVSYINIANFMDGVDGMSALHGGVVGASFVAIGVAYHLPWLSWSGAVIAVAFLAFLPWNVLGGRLFLGDVGSYGLGAASIALVVAALANGVPASAALAPLALYVADTGTVLVARIVRGEAWYLPHRQHAYQRLVDAGYPHLGAASLVAAATAVCAGLGLTLALTGWWWLLLGLLGVVVGYLSFARSARPKAEAHE